MSSSQPPRWHAAAEVLACALVLLHLPLFLVFPPADGAALALGLVLFAVGRARSRRWARDELLRRVDQAEGTRQGERRGDCIQGDVSALASSVSRVDRGGCFVCV